jgi:hypothetical protein
MKTIGFAGCAITLALTGPALPANAQQSMMDPGQAELIVATPGPADAAAIAMVSPGAAAGEAMIQQRLINNHLELVDPRRQSVIERALLDDQGIVSVNQDSGDINNQANVRVIALSLSGAIVDLRSVAAIERSGNQLITSGGSSEDRITGSLGGTTGLVGINQSAGSLNQQRNVMLVGLGATVGSNAALLADTSLATVHGTNNTLQEGSPRPRADVIDGSFAGFRGAAQISQSAGDLNVIGNSMAISVIELTPP